MFLNQKPLMTNFKNYYIILFSFVLLFGCQDDIPKAYKKKSYQKEVIVFYPSWKQHELAIHDIPWDKITRIIYAFAAPNEDGSLNTSNLKRLSPLVKAAHKNGVEVYVSLGGNNGGKHLPIVASDKIKRTKFVNEIIEYASKNNLDGIDVDWEYLSHSDERHDLKNEQMAFVVFLHYLKDQLKPLGKDLSIDVYGSYWGGKFFMDEALKYVDQVHIMAYDYSGKWSDPGFHSSMKQTIGNSKDKYPTGLAYWIETRKWDKRKLYLGVPFYGRDFNHPSVIGKSFRDISAEFPEAINQDSVNNIYYNGIQTMQKKMDLINKKNLPGVMVWELTQDATDANSLLNVIDKKLNK